MALALPNLTKANIYLTTICNRVTLHSTDLTCRTKHNFQLFLGCRRLLVIFRSSWLYLRGCRLFPQLLTLRLSPSLGLNAGAKLHIKIHIDISHNYLKINILCFFVNECKSNCE